MMSQIGENMIAGPVQEQPHRCSRHPSPRGEPLPLRVSGAPRFRPPAIKLVSKGVTLVEVLLAVVILSIGMVGVLRAYGACIATLEISRDIVNEVELLKDKMSQIEQSTIEEGGISVGVLSGQFDGAWEDYTWQTQVESTTDEGLDELILTVTSPLESRQLSLMTYAQDKSYQKDD